MSTQPRYHFTDTAKALISGLHSEGDVFNRSFPLFVANDEVVYHTKLVVERPGASPFISTEIFLLLVDSAGNVIEGTDWSKEEVEAAYRALREPHF
jgi:hypothetical protein